MLHLDWWYDTPQGRRGHRAVTCRRVLAEALLELIREALAQDEMDSGGDEMDLVDLSSSDVDAGEANA